MWDRQSMTSLFTLLGGVAASVVVIAIQPEPADDAATELPGTETACHQVSSRADLQRCGLASIAAVPCVAPERPAGESCSARLTP